MSSDAMLVITLSKKALIFLLSDAPVRYLKNQVLSLISSFVPKRARNPFPDGEQALGLIGSRNRCCICRKPNERPDHEQCYTYQQNISIHYI